MKFRIHLPCIAILFACGILFSLFASQQSLPCLRTYGLFFSCLILNFLLSVLFFLRKKSMAATLCLYLSFFFIGALTLQRQLISVQSQHFPEEGKPAEFTGTVINEPGENNFILRVEKINQTPARFLAIVPTRQAHTLEYGRLVKVTGTLRRLSSRAGPDESGYEAYLARKKICALLDISNAGQIVELGDARVNPLKAAAVRFKKMASSVIDKTFPYPQSGFLKAILLGSRSSLPLQWKEHFSKTGTSHILAISGIHVWMIIGIFFTLFQAAGLSRRGVAIASVAVLLFYCMLVGGRTPVMRASIMAGATLIGKIINRPTKPWNNLALASIAVLAINPFEIANVGFQLSFLAAGGIIYLSPRLENALTLRPSIKKTICPIFSAQIATIPVIACHFNILSPIAFIANLVVIPLLGIILALGLTGCTLGFASTALAAIFNKADSVLITALVEITRTLSRVPFSHIYVQSPGIPFILAYYSAVIIAAASFNKNFCER